MLKLSWKPNHYVAEFTGHVTVKDSLQLYGELVAYEQFDQIRYGLIDFRKLESIGYKDKDFDNHAAHAKSAVKIHRNYAYRAALIVSSAKTEKAIVQFLGSVKEKFPHRLERRIFYSYDNARLWASGD